MKIKLWISRHSQLCLALGILLVALTVVFFPGIKDADQTIWSTDYKMALHRNISEMAKEFRPLAWDATYFLGSPAETFIYPHWPLLATLPLGVSMWLNVLLHFFIAGLGAWILSRKLGIGKWGAALAAIGFGLTSHILSLTHAGHIYKIQSLPWIPWIFAYYYAGWKSANWKYFVAAAMFFALSFQGGEPQVPFYAGLYLAAFTLFLMIADWRGKVSAKKIGKKMSFSLLCAGLTALLALQCLSNFAGVMGDYKNIGERAAESSADTAKQQKEKYDFATGWSFPPEDCATFLMTYKVLGGTSPSYFGRLGTKTMKFRLNDDYMGVAICIFAIAGLLVGRRNKVYPFLVFLLVSSLLIGFGRFTPIYKLIYELPTMASQRAPARWIFFSSLSICILAGIGFEAFISALNDRNKRWYALPAAILASLLILLIVAGGLGVHSADFAQQAFGPEGSIAVSETPALATIRATHVAEAFRRTEFLLFASLLISGGVLWISQRKKLTPLATTYLAGTLFLLLTAADLAKNGKDFIQFYDYKRYHAGNSVIDFFKADQDIYRIQPLGTHVHPAINEIIGPIGRWNGLLFTEIQEQHRMRTEFATIQELLKTEQLPAQLNPRQYDLYNVKYVLSAYNLPADILARCKLKLAKQFSFQQAPPLFIYRYTNFKPFARFTANAIPQATDEAALAEACRQEGDTTTIYSPAVANSTTGSEGTVHVQPFSIDGFQMDVQPEESGWVLVRTLFSENWIATVNGKKTALVKSHGLYPAIPVQASDEHIELRVKRFGRQHIVMLCTWILSIGALVVARKKRSTQPL